MMSDQWGSLLSSLSTEARLIFAQAAVGISRQIVRDLGSPEAQAGLDMLLTEASLRSIDSDDVRRLLRNVPEFQAPPEVFEGASVVGSTLVAVADVLTENDSLSAAVLNDLALLAMDDVWSVQPENVSEISEGEHSWDAAEYQQFPYLEEWTRLSGLALRLAQGATEGEVKSLVAPTERVVEAWRTRMARYDLSRETSDRELVELRTRRETDPVCGVVWNPDLEDLDNGQRNVLVGACLRTGELVALLCGLTAQAEAIRALHMGTALPMDETAVFDPDTLSWITDRVQALIDAAHACSLDPSAGTAHRVALEALRVAGSHQGRGQDRPFIEWDQVRNFDLLRFPLRSQYDEWIRQRSIVLALRKGATPTPFMSPTASLRGSFLRPHESDQ